MKTKNVILVASVIISGILNVSGVFARDVKSDQVTLNIKLQPIQTITVNSGQKNVDIVYSSIEDYANGVSVTQNDHLEVFSTGGFQVKVNTGGDFWYGTESISSTDVRISATKGSVKNDATTFAAETGLNHSETNLLTSTKGGRKLKFNVTYNNKAAGDNDAYILAEKANGENETVYTATVTYTIAAN